MSVDTRPGPAVQHPPASGPAPEPVPRTSAAAQWARRNLFRGPVDTIVTVVAALVVGYVVYRLGRFVFVTGRWDVARDNLTLFIVGPYDRDELWRPVVALIAVCAYGGLWAGFLRRGGLVALTATPPATTPPNADGGSDVTAADVVAVPGATGPHGDDGRDAGPEPRSLRRRVLSLVGRLWPLLLGVVLLLSLARTVTPWLVGLGAFAAAVGSYAAGRFLPMAWLRVAGAVVTVAAAAYYLYVDPFDWVPSALPGPRSIGQMAGMIGMLVAGSAVSVLVGLGAAKVVQRLLGTHDAHRAVVTSLVVGLVGTASFLAVDPFDVVPDLPQVTLINVWLGLVATVAVVVVAVGLAAVRSPAAGLAGAGVFGSLVMLLVLTDAVGWDDWGGMMLNIFLAVVSISLCFPLGVALALGRRSKMPLVRAISTGYIELFRGVPLYVLLVMAGVPLTLFIPRSVTPGLVARAIIVFTLFTAAYVAEIVRGGLQSLPRGQTEAGQALGLSGLHVTFLIVLPQALRNVIPAMVGQFISLFKDTTLAGGALSFLDLLASAQIATRQEDFRGQGLLGETVSFVMLLFWVGSITMSRESQRLERKLGVGTR